MPSFDREQYVFTDRSRLMATAIGGFTTVAEHRCARLMGHPNLIVDCACSGAKAASDESLSAPRRWARLCDRHIFHSGQVWSLKQAVNVMANIQLGAKPSDSEANGIVAFLEKASRPAV
ncbi:hypothetical protein [Bradyrhizobium monzae]|uniref:hypothetical protein n=1 Tax=Bradyrhizobium sp. Oc8 TaxID=2876780 RepID=UPI00320B9FD2